MKTKGKDNESLQKHNRPSWDFHPLNPKHYNIESLKGAFTCDQVKGCLMFVKMIHMEEWKASQDLFYVRQVSLSSFYQQNSNVCHEGVARQFVCNWDERTSNSRVRGQEFSLTREVLLWIFRFKDGIGIIAQKMNDMKDLSHLFPLNSYSPNLIGRGCKIWWDHEDGLEEGRGQECGCGKRCIVGKGGEGWGPTIYRILSKVGDH